MMTSPDTERECTTTRAKLLVAHAFFFPRFSHFSSLLLPNLFSGLSGSGTWQLMPPAITLTHGAMYVTSSAYVRMPVLHFVFCVCVFCACCVRVVCVLVVGFMCMVALQGTQLLSLCHFSGTGALPVDGVLPGPTVGSGHGREVGALFVLSVCTHTTCLCIAVSPLPAVDLEFESL